MPVLLVRRGPVAMRSMTLLHDDPRLELFATDELTSEWISFAQRVAGVIIATEDEPLSALGYAITAGIAAPLIMVIPRKHKVDCKDLVAAGAAACMTMPIAKPELDRIVAELAKHAGSSRIDSTLRLLLDPIGSTVRYHDKEVHLSHREFAVLHCLSLHRGRPVAAEDLLNSVWGSASATDRTRQILDVYIFQLRKKLERIGLRGAISTVRGFGYALVEVTRQQH
jgi:DNA-binding response OmpR family regulator